MTDDRKAQAEALARAKANPAGILPLVIQDHVSVHRRQHGDAAAAELIGAYERLPRDKQYRTTPAAALAAKARHESDSAALSEHAAIYGLEHGHPIFGD